MTNESKKPIVPSEITPEIGSHLLSDITAHLDVIVKEKGAGKAEMASVLMSAAILSTLSLAHGDKSVVETLLRDFLDKIHFDLFSELNPDNFENQHV